jgi:putative transcriptional regulator
VTKKKHSNESPKRSKAKKGTRLGRALISSMKELAAHVSGEKPLPVYKVKQPVDVKEIRERSGLSQAKFAESFGLSFRTVQQWEQGKSVPDGPARSFLRVIDRNPEAVRQALAE